MEYRLALAALITLALPVAAVAQKAPTSIDIKLDSRIVRLANGTRLLMHRDTTMAEVGVEVFIRGGAREEWPGVLGTAHLFEHYLPTSGRFLGNPSNRAIYNSTRRGSGAGTEPDFLRFYLTAKPEGLEAIIGALADRMESDSSKYVVPKLTTDKNVVISELRRVSSVDWDSEVLARLYAGTFGEDHPYGHSPGGTEADVMAATPEHMREWHTRFAGGANTIVIVAGNFDVAHAETLVRKHFESIRAGRAAADMRQWVPAARERHEVVEREIANAYVFLSWPVPGFGTRDGELLRMLAVILANRASVASPVAATVDLWEIAGMFRLRGQSSSAQTIDSTESLLERELARLLQSGPTATELERARTHVITEFVSSLQATVWRGGRGDALGLGLLFRGDADFYRTQIAHIESATPIQLRDTGRRWLNDAGYVLHVLPAPKRIAAPPVDRAATVEPIRPTLTAFPVPRAGTTASGMQLLVAERGQLPLAELTLAIRPGVSPADPLTAAAAIGAFKQMVADSLSVLGGSISTDVDADFATINVSILSPRAPAAAHVLMRAMERTREPLPRRITAAASAEAIREAREARGNPMSLRDRVASCIVTDGGNCGVLPDVERTNENEVARFMAAHYRPANAILIASGAVTAATLGAVTASPARRSRAQTSNTSEAGANGDNRAFVIDFPTATQAHALLIVRLSPDVAADPLLAHLVTFSLRQRLMDNLRTEKGWSYEVYPFGVLLQQDRAYMRYNIPLKLERLADGIAEVDKEAQRLASEPVTEDALNSWKSFVEGSVLLPGLASLSAMNRQLLELPRNELSADYYSSAQQRLRAITPADLQRAAQHLLRPGAMTWIVAGPRDVVEPKLRERGMETVLVK